MTTQKSRQWAAKIIRDNWRGLADVAGPERMPASGPTGTFQFLGCGVHGCVVATADPAIVLKITDDADEAGFAAASMAAPGAPPGVVRYAAAARIPSPRPRFALWREAAHRALLREDVADALGTARLAADVVRSALRRAAASAVAEAVEAARAGDVDGAVTEKADDPTRAAIYAASRLRRPAERAAAGMWLFRRYAEAVEDDLPEVSRALLWWMRRGLLLCDVHSGNVGLVTRGGREVAVIIDPGHALLLDPSYDGVTVRDLPAPRRANPRARRGLDEAFEDVDAPDEAEMLELFRRRETEDARFWWRAVDFPTGVRVYVSGTGSGRRGDGRPAWVYESDGEGWSRRSTESFMDSLRRHDSWDVYLGDRDFNGEFWRHPPRYLYQGSRSVSDVLAGGLEPRRETTGLSNRHLGPAVFLTSNELLAWEFARGRDPGVVRVDVSAMARDGVTPRASREPAVEEREAEAAVARLLGFDLDGPADGESSDPVSYDPDTVVLHGKVPAKYLTDVSGRGGGRG